MAERRPDFIQPPVMCFPLDDGFKKQRPPRKVSRDGIYFDLPYTISLILC